jgi:hypothetical protein
VQACTPPALTLYNKSLVDCLKSWSENIPKPQSEVWIIVDQGRIRMACEIRYLV